MTAGTRSYLLPAILTVGLALWCVRPAQAGSVSQSPERTTSAGSLQQQEANELNKRGIGLLDAGDLDKALEAFNHALELFRQASDQEGEAKALANSGLVYSKKGEMSKARERYVQALDFFRAKPDRAREAELLVRIAFTLDDEKDQKAAAGYYRQAIPLLQAEGNHKLQAMVMLALCADLFIVGENQSMLDLLVSALPLCRSLKDSAKEATALELMAMAYGGLSNNREAQIYYEQSLEVWIKAGDRPRQARVLEGLAGIDLVSGDHEKALRHYNQALSIWRDLKEVADQARLLSMLGGFYFPLGDLQRALSYFNETLLLWQSLDNPAGIAEALDDLGRIWMHQGTRDRALAYFEQSLALWRRAGRTEGEARALSLMGTACNWAGDYQRAADYFNRALTLWQKINDPVGEADTLSNLGEVYSTMILLHLPLPNGVELQEYISRALRRIQDIGPERQAIILNRIGLIYGLSRNTEKAIDYHSQALKLSENSQDQNGIARAQFSIGFAYELSNKPLQALEFYEKSLAIYDKMRASANLEEIKTGLSGSATDAYKHAAALRMQIGDSTRAFELSERARARTLLDQLANLRPRAKQKASAELRQEEQALQSELFSLEKKRKLEISKSGATFDRAMIASIQSQLERKRGEYDKLLVRLKLDDPEYASLRAVAPLTLPEVQALISKDTTLISYFVTDEQTLIFIVRRDSFQAVKVEVTEAELKREVEGFRQFPTLSDSAPVEMKRLHEQLIAPVSKYIKTPITAIIPHGILNYLPFAALTDGRRYFGEDHVVYYLPSANVLPFIQKASRQTQKEPASTQIMVIAQSQATGLPPLQYADEEAGAVANLFHTKALGKVSKATFLKQSGDYSILHIAAHGELDSVNPLFSRIWLAPDENDGGALTVHEVYDMDLQKTSMVVLSACETQLGAQSKGDDITGLNRAFIYAGTPTVVASLWTVDDQTTGLLMRSFYTHLRSGMGKAEALRAAQSETRQRYPNPYYWAAFVLTGDAGPANRFSSPSQRSASTRR